MKALIDILTTVAL